MSKKYTLLTFKGICMNFLLELNKFILNYPVTSKQPHKIVQIHMGHPVYTQKTPVMMLTLARDPRLAPEAVLGNPIQIFILRVRVSRIYFPDTTRYFHKLDSFTVRLVLCINLDFW